MVERDNSMPPPPHCPAQDRLVCDLLALANELEEAANVASLLRSQKVEDKVRRKHERRKSTSKPKHPIPAPLGNISGTSNQSPTQDCSIHERPTFASATVSASGQIQPPTQLDSNHRTEQQEDDKRTRIISQGTAFQQQQNQTTRSKATDPEYECAQVENRPRSINQRASIEHPESPSPPTRRRPPRLNRRRPRTATPHRRIAAPVSTTVPSINPHSPSETRDAHAVDTHSAYPSNTANVPGRQWDMGASLYALVTPFDLLAAQGLAFEQSPGLPFQQRVRSRSHVFESPNQPRQQHSTRRSRSELDNGNRVSSAQQLQTPSVSDTYLSSLIHRHAPRISSAIGTSLAVPADGMRARRGPNIPSATHRPRYMNLQEWGVYLRQVSVRARIA
jgi:hypothetical protein